MANYSQRMGQKVSPPYQDCSPLSPWPLLPGHHSGSPPPFQWPPHRPFCSGRLSEHPLLLPCVPTHSLSLGMGRKHPHASTYHSILVPADRGEKGPQNHSEKKEGREGPASKEMQTSCYSLTTRTSISLLSTLQKFIVPELKVSSKPPSARHYDPAYFTGKTRGPRRGGVVIQPVSLNKS